MMEQTEIDFSDWLLLAIGGEEYLVGRGAGADTLILSAPLVDIDPAVTPGWAVADGGARYRLQPSAGLRDDQDRQDAADLLTGSLAAWGVPDTERAEIMGQLFGTPQP